MARRRLSHSRAAGRPREGGQRRGRRLGSRARFERAHPPAARAQVAQLVEHVTENHGVGGSIPPLGTISWTLPPARVAGGFFARGIERLRRPSSNRPAPQGSGPCPPPFDSRRPALPARRTARAAASGRRCGTRARSCAGSVKLRQIAPERSRKVRPMRTVARRSAGELRIERPVERRTPRRSCRPRPRPARRCAAGPLFRRRFRPRASRRSPPIAAATPAGLARRFAAAKSTTSARGGRPPPQVCSGTGASAIGVEPLVSRTRSARCLLGLAAKLRIGCDLRRDARRFARFQLAVEPGEEFFVAHHLHPTRSRSAVRPRTSRLDTVPIGSPSISAVSR